LKCKYSTNYFQKNQSRKGFVVDVFLGQDGFDSIDICWFDAIMQIKKQMFFYQKRGENAIIFLTNPS